METSSTDLPVPRDALLELGLSDEQIDDAVARRPLVVACQAQDAPGAWFDVAAVAHVLKALRSFKHTKGRWGGVPLVPDPWQIVWIIAPVFGWLFHDPELGRAVRVVRSVWVEVPRKAGKALALDTPIPTPTGWTTQGEVQVGDAIFAGDGTPTRVVAVTNVMNGRPCYTVTFSDGEQITADASHLWRTATRVQGRNAELTGLRTTQELHETCNYGDRGDRNHAVALAGALELPSVDLSVDPYVFGYWLGDGHSADARFTVAEGDMGSFSAQVAAAGYHLGEAKPYANSPSTMGVRVSVTPIRKGSSDALSTRLRSLGVLRDKRIPMEYLRSSRIQRLSLLQGLMDSDGHISARGVAGNITRCEFTSCNAQLADNVLDLVRSLGIKATLRHGRATIDRRDVGPKYRVTFTAHSDIPVFRLPRKLARQVAPPATGYQRARSRSRQVVAVDATAAVPVRCIQVENHDGMYLVGRSFVPTHNSTLSSGLSLVLLLADREVGAEVYAAAGSLTQAGRVFEDARRMVQTSKPAASRVEVLSEVLRVPRTGGVMRALSRIAEAAHGLNVSGAVVDEVHVHKRRDLIDAIETGTGAREQPLILFITTADEGSDGSIYAEKHEYTRKVAVRLVTDPTHYGVVWAAEPGDDPFAEETWRKANPGLGVSPSLAYLRKEAQRAQSTPSYLPTFLRLHLNLRTRSSIRWLPLPVWDEGAGLVDEDRLKRRRAWGGLDLAAVSDLTAWVLAVEDPADRDVLDVVCRFYLPYERLEAVERQVQVPLGQWAREGFLTLTEGEAVDYAAVEDDIVRDARTFDLQRVTYDRMFAGQLAQNLETRVKGLQVAAVAQTFSGLSPGAKEMERRVLGRTLRHGGNPLLRWMVNVVEVDRDRFDNIKPVKPDRAASTARVDGVHALVMAMDGYLRRPVARKRRQVVGY